MASRLDRVRGRLVRTLSRTTRHWRARTQLPEALFPVADDWVAELRSFRWLDDDRFEVTGWAYDRGVDYTGQQPRLQLWLELQSGIKRFVPLATSPSPSPEVNQSFNGATTSRDYSGTCFIAVGSLTDLRRLRTGQVWQLRAGVAVPGHEAQGRFRKHYALGSAGYLMAGRRGGAIVIPTWSAGGLTLEVRADRPVATDLELTPEGGIRIDVESADGITEAALVAEDGRVPLQIVRADGRSFLEGPLPTLPDGAWSQYRVVARVDGAQLPVVVASAALIDAHPLLAEAGEGSGLYLNVGGPWALVTGVALIGADQPCLEVVGKSSGDLSQARFELANERDVRAGQLTCDGTDFRLVVPFLQSKWNLPALPPQIGRMTLRAFAADGTSLQVRCSTAVVELAPSSELNYWFRLYYAVGAGRTLAPRLEIPLRDDEIGTHNQARIQADYLGGVWPIIDQMYFESFYGRQCGCSPLALRNELAERHPKVPRVWAVRDLSVAVPEGDRAVVDATTDWWRARAESRWLVVNDWLRARFAPRDGQTVMQTWHGTMYKKVGLDRGEQLDAEEREFMLGERKKWDLLLSQNPHSTRVFRESYLSNPPIYEEGYPRNDLLVNGDPAPIREVLGIRPSQRVILYAPTWRDDRTELVDFLDVNRLAADLGPDYVVLLRAHSRVIRVGSAAKVADGVIDVSTYPNTTDLLLISDVMITDYSSIMFDYAVTGRPMIFFTPDMDEYRDQLRGVYLDLEKVGPGPVVSTQDEVLDALRRIDEVAAAFAARYAQWQADYTPWDDGGSSRRVLDRYLVDAPPADPAILD
ncbi:CDP-glycerol glycerophosphotransferase (TagB/SpsB family) [Propionicimonas paludicola]|uniref:CDP-glycerol glycerophosphotransferase (TagB/SpsB family) n=1 Tax=Propionicimonas paludicola TaxID=185243 RepID=A0A2A9CTT2_9ACTN|nr:CDP-glycerol glycerophosphotransferase family protein [Propionicimonas paludicola]PFG17834.1 CDP-glycerol glycerophosphotransferase (TagB/SpsB family) [Propionicimonas paludicola]